MADINSYCSQIEEAERGEVVRDSIVDAMKNMKEEGINVKALSGRKIDNFAKYTEVNAAFIDGKYNKKSVYETDIKKNSNRAVTSGALYEAYVTIYNKMAKLLGTDPFEERE